MSFVAVGLSPISIFSRLTAASAVLLVVLLSPPPAQADPDAGAFLREFTKRAMEQLTERNIDESEQERRFHILIQEGFDIPSIGRFVLGRYWRPASEAQRVEFLSTFEDMIVHRFQPLFSEYSGERIKVGLVRPFKNNPDFVSVSSEVEREANPPVKVDWRIRRREGEFKVVDIVAEGISIAVTLRSEYNSVLKQNGGDVGALTEVLRGKIAGL